MIITAEQASDYFWHPANHVAGGGDELQDEGFAYFARDGVCLAFHNMPWPRVIAVHVGAMPEAWGKAVNAAVAMLNDAWRMFRPERIVAWVKEYNRAAIAFAKRCGFVIEGRLDMPEPVIMMGWKPCQSSAQ